MANDGHADDGGHDPDWRPRRELIPPGPCAKVCLLGDDKIALTPLVHCTAIQLVPNHSDRRENLRLDLQCRRYLFTKPSVSRRVVADH